MKLDNSAKNMGHKNKSNFLQQVNDDIREGITARC